jgi:hypothetical protein
LTWQRQIQNKCSAMDQIGSISDMGMCVLKTNVEGGGGGALT